MSQSQASLQEYKMAETNSEYKLYCGVDIAAQTFTAALLQPTAQQPRPDPTKAVDFHHNPADYTRFEKWLQTHTSQGQGQGQVAPTATLVVMEATGTYWIHLAVRLQKQGYSVAVINPSQSRDFARSMLLKPKTDQLDAQVLARLGQALQPAPWTPPPQLYHELYQRLSHRDSLIELSTMIRNQLHALKQNVTIIESVKAQKEALLAILKAQIKAVEDEIAALTLDQSQEWNRSISLLQSVPGIGLVTACWLVVASLNFSACTSGESLVHYAGLAPVIRKSGKSINRRALLGHGGNARLRVAMYMAAVSALRFNEAIKAYAAGLRANKRTGKEICCAAARKLLQIAYAMVKSGKAFEVGRYAQIKEQKQQYAQSLLKVS
jgi:transposase